MKKLFNVLAKNLKVDMGLLTSQYKQVSKESRIVF